MSKGALAVSTPSGTSKINSLRGGIARAMVIVGLLLTFGWISALAFGFVNVVWLVAEAAVTESNVHVTDLPTWIN